MKRAAAIYIAFFLIVAVGSYVMIGAAQQPERVSGLWGVSILSGSAAVFLILLAYLPAKS